MLGIFYGSDITGKPIPRTAYTRTLGRLPAILERNLVRVHMGVTPLGKSKLRCRSDQWMR